VIATLFVLLVSIAYAEALFPGGARRWDL